MRFGTTILPDRNLGDDETGHDIIDVDIGENEEIKEVELVKAGAAYRRRMQTTGEALKSVELWEDGQAVVREMGAEPAPHPKGQPRMVNERVKGYSQWRYRLVTLEQIDVDALEAGEEITDAEVVEGSERPAVGPGEAE